MGFNFSVLVMEAWPQSRSCFSRDPHCLAREENWRCVYTAQTSAKFISAHHQKILLKLARGCLGGVCKIVKSRNLNVFKGSPCVFQKRSLRGQNKRNLNSQEREIAPLATIEREMEKMERERTRDTTKKQNGPNSLKRPERRVPPEKTQEYHTRHHNITYATKDSIKIANSTNQELKSVISCAKLKKGRPAGTERALFSGVCWQYSFMHTEPLQYVHVYSGRTPSFQALVRARTSADRIIGP